MEKESILKDRTIVGSPLTHLFSLGILMFVFWLALSGDFAVKFVVYGLITSAVVAWICYPLLLLPNADGTKKYFALGVSPIAFLCYSLWLLKELVLANIDVVKATVRPELRIDPKVISFVFRADNPMAKVLLANSITLTPGTVTINVTPEGIYEVHALTDGAAEGLLPRLCRGGRLTDTLILAPPGLGKTTLLRDLIRQVSDGTDCEPLRVALADERGEVAALYQGLPQLDVGAHTDVLDGCPKAQGLMLLLRAMNPQVLAVDEITAPEDVAALCAAAGCGVTVLATAHGENREDLLRRAVYAPLWERGLFRRLVTIRRGKTGREYVVEELN